MGIEILGAYRGEKTGTLYTVQRLTKLISHSPLGGPASQEEGSHEYKTVCGMDLNLISDDLSKFETVNLSGDDELIVRV